MTAPTTLEAAAAAIPGRLRALADRPGGLTVSTLIDRYMAAYAGRDPSMANSLHAWSVMIGAFTLEEVDRDLTGC